MFSPCIVTQSSKRVGPPSFLVVDDNDEHRFLLVKTLLRKFPNAVLHECQDDGTALTLVRTLPITAAVIHRSAAMTGVELVRSCRRLNARLIIIMVSGIDRTSEALAAGANAFLNYDEWLRIGTVVASFLTAEGHEQNGTVAV